MTTLNVNPGDVVLVLTIEDANALLNSLDRDCPTAIRYYIGLAIEQTIGREVAALDDILPNLRDPWANAVSSTERPLTEGRVSRFEDRLRLVPRQFDPTDQDPT